MTTSAAPVTDERPAADPTGNRPAGTRLFRFVSNPWGETRFLWVLAVVAIAEPILLSATHLTITGFAGIVFAVQCVVAASVLALGLRARRGRVAEAT